MLDSCNFFVRRPEWERSPGKPRDRPSLENNIGIQLEEIVSGLDLTGSGYFPVVDNCEHGTKYSD
jgi:hypothetical protein